MYLHLKPSMTTTQFFQPGSLVQGFAYYENEFSSTRWEGTSAKNISVWVE
jgi:hypothetical protein